MPLRATVPTSWTLGWSFFWAEDWSALWAMVRSECDVAPVQNTTRRTEKQQMQSRIRKVATLAAARNALPVPVTEQIVQEIKSLYPADPEPQAPASAPISAMFLSEVAEQVPSTLRKMPRLGEPGPLGMRAEHWYDFGSLAGNSDLFVQVVAHIAAAAVPNSVLQYLKAGQITPLAKPTGGHRPLLMMSFLCRLALKSVMAAKKESVAKCAGPFQYGVGRPDGANTMIKTIQYLAEADNSRVLVALDLKAAFQNVSRRAMLHSLLKLTLTSQQSSPGGTQAPRNTECTTTLPTPKSLPTVGWIRVVLYQHVDSQQLLTQHFTQSWLSFALSTTQAPNSLPTLMIGTSGSNRNASYRQLLLSQPLPDQSILLYSPPKHKFGKALAKTQFHRSSKTKSRSHSVVWEDIYKSMKILNPALSCYHGENYTTLSGNCYHACRP